MASLEKYLFLGAVTVAIILMARTPDTQPPAHPGDLADTGLASDSPAANPSSEGPLPAMLTLTPAPRGHLDTLLACKGTAPSLGNNVDGDLRITDFKPLVVAQGSVTLATAPVGGGCLSSVFGPRNGRLHKGVDFYHDAPVPIYAAAAGKIRRRLYREDYGNMVVIDHGAGIYTRYAHLEDFADIRQGDQVAAGQMIGTMGNTAGYRLPRHLHYEVLTGQWGARSGSFALEPVDVLALPAAGDPAP